MSKEVYTVEVELDIEAVVEALKECEREAGTRRGIYPRWIREGRINAGVAYERQRAMDAAARVLKQVATSMKRPYQPGLDFAGSGKEA
jgi:hypothetical protein